MSLSFDSSAGDAYVAMSAGGTGAMGTGAHTIAVLWYGDTASGGFNNRDSVGLYASATLTRELINDTGNLFGFNDFSSGYGTQSANAWYVAAICKPAGSATYRSHLWAYASDGSGTMSHGVEAGAASQGDGSAITQIRIGLADIRTNGLIAVVGLWTSVLSDAQLDTLKSPNLSSWSALSPQALITGNNWNGSTGCNDVVGTSNQQSITGTVGVGAEPPSFNYTLTVGMSAPWFKF